MAAGRLQHELMQVMMAGDSGATAFPSGDSLFEWSATIEGCDGTVYEGMTYKLRMTFSEKYPYQAPTVVFETPCFHPNVDEKGNICLDILKEKWSAAYSVATVLQSLRSLLSDPNNDSPLNTEAAQLWGDEAAYRKVLQRKAAAV